MRTLALPTRPSPKGGLPPEEERGPRAAPKDGYRSLRNTSTMSPASRTIPPMV